MLSVAGTLPSGGIAYASAARANASTKPARIFRMGLMAKNARQKQACTLGSGLFEEGFARRILDNAPFVHEDDAAGDIARKTHFVRDANHGHAFAGETGHDIENL